MAGRVKMPCKVCGKEFYPCDDCLRSTDATGTFHWRGVVDNEDCAKIYFRRALKGLATNCTQEEEDEYDKQQLLLSKKVEVEKSTASDGEKLVTKNVEKVVASKK